MTEDGHTDRTCKGGQSKAVGKHWPDPNKRKQKVLHHIGDVLSVHANNQVKLSIEIGSRVLHDTPGKLEETLC